METTPKPSFLHLIARRFGIAIVGWLYALPYVLVLPLIFWLIVVPYQMTGDTFESSLPFLGMAAFVHLLAFLILGLPLFLFFWQKRSLIWYLPNSLLLGFLISGGLGLPLYYSGGNVYPPLLLICVGYGVTTAFGCWVANWRNGKRVKSVGTLFLSVGFCITVVIVAASITG